MPKRDKNEKKRGRKSPNKSAAATPRAVPANVIPLAATPVEHVFAEHVRIRIACDLLVTLANDPAAANPELPGILSSFFQRDFARHAEDEEKDFLPLLESRLAAAGVSDESPRRLRAEHRAERNSLKLIVPSLGGLAKGHGVADLAAWRMVIESFTNSVRDHMAWEEDALGALAKTHLLAADRAALAAALARRRGGTRS